MKILVTGGSGFIGTNLVNELLNRGDEFINLDINKPKLKEQFAFWKPCDILDYEKVKRIFAGFSPSHVLHLAARTDIDGAKLGDYEVNTIGTQHILDAVKCTKSVYRLIITSSQFVHQFQGMPSDNEDFAPYTIYGESKMVSEKLTRTANLDCVWTIIRPTNIWGAWHPRYPNEFWRIIGEGKYVHPGKKEVIRSYGYVKNVIHQIFRLFNLDQELVNKKVYYVGDKPINLIDWVNAFSKAQLGKEVLVVPRLLVFSLAILGDIITSLGLSFPITTSRYKSMITNNPAPMEETFDTLGSVPYTLVEAVSETVKWLRKYYPAIVKVTNEK
jgi:GlcNAc-P-P-Und epimerase